MNIQYFPMSSSQSYFLAKEVTERLSLIMLLDTYPNSFTSSHVCVLQTRVTCVHIYNTLYAGWIYM